MSVANCAKLVLVNPIEVAYLLSAFCIQAGKAVTLLCDTLACVTTCFVAFLTEGNWRLIDFLLFVSTGIDKLIFLLFILNDKEQVRN